MNIEVIDLYPMYGEHGRFLYCSAHVYLVDQGIDLRGYKIRITPDKVELFDPTERAIEKGDSSTLRTYPVFTFLTLDLKELILPLVSEPARKLYDNPETFMTIPHSYVTYQTEIFRLAAEHVKVQHKIKALKVKAKPTNNSKGPKKPSTSFKKAPPPKPRPPITGFKPKARNKV